MSHVSPAPFQIRPGPAGGRWTWRVADGDGGTVRGEAPTRAAAAACVIRVLVTAAKPH